MLFPSSAFDRLGYNQVKELIKQYCLSDSSRELVDKMKPQRDLEQIHRFLKQTSEFKELLEHDDPFPIDHLYPIRPLAEKLRLEGSLLLEEELAEMLLSLRTVFAMTQYFVKRVGQYIELELLFEPVAVHEHLIRDIERVINEYGKIKENASPLLSEISRDIQKSEREAMIKLEELFKRAREKGYAAEGNLTVRSGRMCIPILAEYKRRFKGMIHDESATGQTIYMEPEEVVVLNNSIRDLEFAKKREVRRILLEVADLLRPYLRDLFSYHTLLTRIDFIRAKACLARELGAEMPSLVDEPALELVNARHPLLWLSAKKEGASATVVPLNIKIDETDRIILVSGPNAGGKSVCMKTVGLLQLMAQSGILIPADEESRIGVFSQMFADIGDDQSIESDLSTYSAHLTKMKHFTSKANPNTLVLIDEFGTGTDPQFGGPIAEAILEELNQKKVCGVITTHYSNLKNYASRTPGIENASMLFDNKALMPLYILQVGKPGSSYALEIAQKIGLGSSLIESAKQKIGEEQRRMDDLLIELEREKTEVMEVQKQVRTHKKLLDEKEREVQELQQFLEENRRKLISEAKKEARAIVKDANKLIENTISQIKTVKAEKEETKRLREEFGEGVKRFTERKAKKAPKTTPKDQVKEIEVGDWVELLDSGTQGEVIEIARNNFIIALGELRTVVKKNKVKRLNSKQKSQAKKKSQPTRRMHVEDSFSSELDVRGMRTDDALQLIENTLDKAVMSGYPSLRIIHGKGNGILRKFIRDYLRKYDHVSSYEDEHVDRGGDGITYAYLK